jgi:GTP-binding protein HflX
VRKAAAASTEHAEAQARPTGRGAARERAYLVGVAIGRDNRGAAETSLGERAHLARSAGADVVGSQLQVRGRADAATLIGSGKATELAKHCAASDAGVVVFDDELTPAQQRNIERLLGRKTLDRTQLILDIFARRARTREGRLQVELAQLDYLLPRLSGKGILLSRLGGGIGTRGPGETKIESDRRRIRARIQSIRRAIDDLRRHRATNRDARRRTALPVVALVGYTNAGKSTLFNALTAASAPVSEQLFMTLDPLVRRASLSKGQDLLLVDTVGFIRKLPHDLVAAFRATLEEVRQADLLLHVVDATSEDRAGQEAAVAAVLEELDADTRPCLLVLNKVDRVDLPRREAMAAAQTSAVWLSAKEGLGLDELRRQIARRLGLIPRRRTLSLSVTDGATIAAIHRFGQIYDQKISDGRVSIDADVPAWFVERYRSRLL